MKSMKSNFNKFKETSQAVSLSCLIFSLFPYIAKADSSLDLFSLSLQELSEIEIKTSSLKATPLKFISSAITVITREQIQRTPAKNIIDLLEVYVPGLLVIANFSTGPRIRMRGLGERNVHTLLLVNGKPANQKSQHGSMVELRNWDMADIERVEVVRGPGSVAHGAGAISGVINIITKKAGEYYGLNGELTYNEQYRSRGGKLSYGRDIGDSNIFFHASYIKTEGVKDIDTFQMLSNGEMGYKGSDVFSGSDAFPLQDYFGDFDDEPQVKLYVDLNINEQWRFWTRYNNSGQSSAHTQRVIQDKMQDWRIFQNRYYIASLEHNAVLSNDWSVNSTFSYDSEDFIDTKAKQANFSNTHELNRSVAFSEDELYFKSAIKYKPSDQFSLITAFEYSHDTIGAPWGDPDGSFIVKTGGKVFISEDSIYLGNGKNGTYAEKKVAEFTSGWSTNTYSLAAELNYQLTSSLNTIMSGRIDKNDQTDRMFSPRLAAVYQVDEKNIFKASWQRSLRMNTLVELHWLELNNKDDKPEYSNTFEFSWHYMPSDQLQFSLTAFHNESEILSWDGDNSNLVGVVKGYGIEPELAYRTDTLSFGINHSFYQLEDWDFKLKQEDGSSSQTVSYSDFNYFYKYLRLTDSGKSLTDWVKNQTKLWIDYQVNEQWTVHFDGRIIWGFDYGDDMFAMYKNAYQNVDTDTLTNKQLTEYNNDLGFLNDFIKTTKKKGVYNEDIRVNLSVIWSLPFIDDAELTFYSQNLISSSSNIRQKVNFTTKELPAIGWIEEPRTFGIKFTKTFN